MDKGDTGLGTECSLSSGVEKMVISIPCWVRMLSDEDSESRDEYWREGRTDGTG